MAASFLFSFVFMLNFFNPSTDFNLALHYKMNRTAISVPVAKKILSNKKQILVERRLALEYLRRKKIPAKFFTSALRTIKDSVLQRDLKIALGKKDLFKVKKNRDGFPHDLLYFPKSTLALAFYSPHLKKKNDTLFANSINWGSMMRQQFQKKMYPIFKTTSWFSLDSLALAVYKTEKKIKGTNNYHSEYGIGVILRGAVSWENVKRALKKFQISNEPFMYKLGNRYFLKIKRFKKNGYVFSLNVSEIEARSQAEKIVNNIKMNNRSFIQNKRFYSFIKKGQKDPFFQFHLFLPKKNPIVMSGKVIVQAQKQHNALSLNVSSVSKGLFYAFASLGNMKHKEIVKRTFMTWKRDHLLLIDEMTKKVSKHKKRFRIAEYKAYISGITMEEKSSGLVLSAKKSFNLQDFFIYLRSLKYLELIAKVFFEK